MDKEQYNSIIEILRAIDRKLKNIAEPPLPGLTTLIDKPCAHHKGANEFNCCPDCGTEMPIKDCTHPGVAQGGVCPACGECIELCQMDALEAVNNHTEVLKKRCIGCAVCVSACATDAISLIKKDKETIPPKNNQEMYKKMIKERFGLFGTLKILGKAALGKKI